MDQEIKRLPKQARSVETRRRLLDAALSLFKTQGFLETTARQISERAGVSVGAFYVYFPDKKAVFSELMEAYFQDFQDLGIRTYLAESGDPGRRTASLHHLIQSVFEFTNRMGDFYTALNLLFQEDAEVAGAILEFESKIVASIAEILRSLPEVEKASDPEAQAFLFYAFIDLTISRLRYPLPGVTAERTQEEMVRWLERLLYPARPA